MFWNIIAAVFVVLGIVVTVFISFLAIRWFQAKLRLAKIKLREEMEKKMAEEREKREREGGEIDVKAIIRLIERATEQMRAKAKRHFWVGTALYFFLIAGIIISLSLFLGWLYGLGFFGVWLMVTLAKTFFSVEANYLRFVTTFGLVRRAVSHGLHGRLWPLERLHWIEIRLVDTKIPVEETVELKRTRKAPRNLRIIKARLIVRAVNPYIYAFVMAGGDTEGKRDLIEARFKDRLQSFINIEGLSEDDVDSLSGIEIFDALTKEGEGKKKRYAFTLEDWGMELRSIEIAGIEVSEETKKQRTKEYEEMAKALGFTREMEQIALVRYGKPLVELTGEEREDIYLCYYHKKSIEALRPTDKTILGGPRKILEEIIPEQIAEMTVGGRSSKK